MSPVPTGDVAMEFPWPPPRATAKTLLPSHLLASGNIDTLGAVAAKIDSAVARAGIQEWAVYTIGDSGFAYVTRLERIDQDGRPKPPPDRWPGDSGEGPRNRSFLQYIKSLFVAEPGFYRVIAVVVTSRPVADIGNPLSRGAADSLLLGPQILPASLRARKVHNLSAYALIYQFKSINKDAEPRLLSRTTVPPAQHLSLAGFWTPAQLAQK